MNKKPDLLIKNIGLLATPQGNSSLAGLAQREIQYIKNAYILISGQDILEIGADHQLAGQNISRDNITSIDAQGSLVTPGLVDAHTHLVFAGWRQQELALKLKGVPYLEILKMGGGILNTVRHTRAAALDELIKNGEVKLRRMLAHGTTTCEAKSGYGLNFADEIKSLKAAVELNKLGIIDIVSTFLAAHAIPEEYKNNKEEYIKL
ncbi:MAG: imidazolonepropionase, partial [Dehalobacterium sp.]